MISASLACQSLALSKVSNRALSISKGISSEDNASCVPQLRAKSADPSIDGDEGTAGNDVDIDDAEEEVAGCGVFVSDPEN